MAFTDQVVAVARETKLFVGLEATPGVQEAPTAGGMNLVLLAGAGEVNQAIRLIDDPQFRNTRSRLTPITGSFDPGAWNFPVSLKVVPGAGAPAEPEIDPILQALMGLPSATDTTWFGSTPHRAYKLRGVDPGATIYPSMTMWFKVGHTAHYCVGATCNQGEFEISGNELASATFSGEFMRRGFCGTDRPAASTSGTALGVVNARKFHLADPADRIYIQFQRTNGALEPVGGVAVTAINYGSNVLTLASSQSWSTDDVVVPFLPAGTEVGIQMYGKYGLVRIADFVGKDFGDLPSDTQIVTAARVTINNGIVYHADLKDDSRYPTQYVVPGFREVTGELELFAYRNIPEFDWKSLQCPPHVDYAIVPAQAGCEPGTPGAGELFEIHLPNVIWQSAAMSGEDEKVATIPFRATATTDFNDELALLYVGG